MPWSKRQRLLTIIACALVVALGALFYVKNVVLPEKAREYVERRHPGVRVLGNITVDPFKATFRSVTVQKEGLVGKLKKVSVLLHFDWSDFKIHSAGIYVRGGTLQWDRDTFKPPQSSGQTKSKDVGLVAFQLDLLKVKEKEATIVARNVVYDGEKGRSCCAEAAIFLHPGFKYSMFVEDGRVDLKGICMDQDKRVQVTTLSTTVKLPRSFPGIGLLEKNTFDVLATGIKLDPSRKDIWMRNLAIEGLFDSESTVIQSESDHLVVKADNFATDHPWVSFSDDGDMEFVVFPHIEMTVPYNGVGPARLTSQDVSVDVNLKESQMSGKASCQEWAAALPRPKVAALSSPDFFEGDLSFTVETFPAPAVELDYDCQASCDHPLIQSLTSGEFQYEAYTSDGVTTFSRTTGHLTSNWVPLASLPVYVAESFINLEDPSFLKHRGLLRGSLVAALRENIRSRRFNIGGSTISQQLAKNLWLTRDRSFSRKGQEALLTMALESCLTKGKILELYMNVVEYAPDVYGLGNASQHYFAKNAQELTPEEAYYLASVLPHPKTVTPPDQGGLDKTRYLMSKLAEDGRIPKGLLISRTSLDTSDWDVLE